jgi:hypothetical protein
MKIVMISLIAVLSISCATNKKEAFCKRMNYDKEKCDERWKEQDKNTYEDNSWRYHQPRPYSNF